MSIVQETWDELGRTIKARHSMCFIRTDVPPLMTPGGIIIPAKTAMFYNGLPNPGGNNPVTKWATVIAAGPEAEVAPGDRVCFMRLDFAWSDKMKDGSFFGWVKGENILLKDTPDEEDGDAAED
jgi:hypothetical protein